MSELCKLKGHMWFVNERREIGRLDGIFSIATELKCARCGKEEKVK